MRPITKVTIVAHVDDFLVLGTEKQLRELIASLQEEYECTGQLLGHGEGLQPELKFLGRTITLEKERIAWEGDKRHVKSFQEKLEEEFMDVEDGKRGRMKGAKTQGVKLDRLPERNPLNPAKSKSNRGLVALAKFVVQDRADIGFAGKEVRTFMSDPAECDILPLKRLGRYLTEHPRCINLMRWQNSPSSWDCYSDSDWGGDLGTRRSTSGGCIFYGDHMLANWSRTQQVISLSSAEAELHGLTKCASEGLAAKNMGEECFINIPMRLLTDSSAAKGIILRNGVGKVKHLEVKCLWVQEPESAGGFARIKVPRLENCSDLLTHHYSENEVRLHLTRMGLVLR